MIVLGLDTTGPNCSVSLVDEASVRAHISRDIGRGHAEVLASMVAEAFIAAELSPNDVDRIAVCTGPGSFTGLRVALSFAKGFALPRSLPIVGIDALAVTASTREPDGIEFISAFRDIRRGEVFYGEFSNGFPMTAVKAMPREEMVRLNEVVQFDLIEAKNIDTRILAWLAMDRDPEIYPAEPLYSRGPDAKLPGGKSPPKIKA